MIDDKSNDTDNIDIESSNFIHDNDDTICDTSLSNSVMSSNTIFTDTTDMSSGFYDDYSDNRIKYSDYVNIHLLNLHIIDIDKEIKNVKDLPDKIKSELTILSTKSDEYNKIIESKTKENTDMHQEKQECIDMNVKIDDELIVVTHKVIPLNDTFSTIKRDEKIMRMNRDLKKNMTRIKEIEKSIPENKNIIHAQNTLLNTIDRDIKVLKNIELHIPYYSDKLKYYKTGYRLHRYSDIIYKNRFSLFLTCTIIGTSFGTAVHYIYNKHR